jgi:hypothetical protein
LIPVQNHSSNIGGSIHIQQKKARENTKDLFKSRAEKLILYSSYSCFCNKKYRHERPVNLPIIYTTYAILFPILKLNFHDRNIWSCQQLQLGFFLVSKVNKYQFLQFSTGPELSPKMQLKSLFNFHSFIQWNVIIYLEK